MKKALISIMIMLVCISLLSGALAVNYAYDNCEILRLPHSILAAANSNDWSQSKPVIVFFPGTKECASVGKTLGFIGKYHLYDDMDVNFLAASFKRGGPTARGWRQIAQDVADYLTPLYREKPFPIIVDGVSYGGYPACIVADLLRDNGITVTEINLADGCMPNLSDADWLRNIAAGGVRVNLWGCKGCSKVSKKGREIIGQLEGTENFYGLIVNGTHGQVLDRAIHEHGLHAEYRAQKAGESK